MGSVTGQSASDFGEDVSKYQDYARQHDLRMREAMASGNPYSAIAEIAGKYRVARNFRTRFDVGVGLRRYEPVIKALQDFHPDRASDPVRAVLGLTERLQKVYEREVLSASSKFLWFLWGRDVIIYDSQALKSLSRQFPQLSAKNYVGYCEAWAEQFAKCKEQIAQECAVRDAPAEEWFYQRVFDWHLWRLGR
jgi:hypothetical protein